VLNSTSPWTPLSDSERRVVLDLLVHGPLSRTELADRLGLSTPSLTRLTRTLLESGVVQEVREEQPHTGGRPLQPLDVDAGLQTFIGIKLTATHAFAVLTDLRADIRASLVRELGDRDPAAVAELLGEVVQELSEGNGPAAVGVGLGGEVRESRFVRRAPFLRWKDVDLGPLVRRATDLPSIVTNDLDALMEAEHWFGDGRDVTSFATITIGVGVGMGLIVHDRLVGGPDSGLGLIGHFPLDPFGPSCPDGHRGCADAMLVNESIRAQASQLSGRTMTYDEVLDLAEVGDPAMEQLVARSAHALGVLVAAVANIAQPRRIILTGEGVRIARVGEVRMRESIRRMRDPLASEPDLRIIDDDPLLWARGAAAVAIQRTVLDLLPET